MIILGLHNDVDSGACLLRDGKIVEAINEERLTRVKMFQGFPEMSLNYILQHQKLSLNDIDYFVYGWYGKQNNYLAYALKLAKRISRAITNDASCWSIIEERMRVEFDRDEQTRAKFEAKMQERGIPREKVVYFDHHMSHAWSAFAMSPFDKAFVFTSDGRGDLKSTTASLATEEKGIEEYDYLLSFDSLGFLYGQITHYLGFTPHKHEGKVTGLAAYGDPQKTLPLFNKMITWNEDSIMANLGFYRPFYTNLSPKLTKELSKFTKEDIAAGVQRHCEDLMLKYIKHWIKKMNRPDIKNICLAGGLFANVRLNQLVMEIEGIENVYIFPHMGDGGLFVGSACNLNFMLTGQSKYDLPAVYLGPEYSDQEILETLKGHSDRIQYRKAANKIEETVKLLCENKIVGYFDGKMEFGPRALGARSILYPARDEETKDLLNERLRRTEFMPFAPVTPREYASECYLNWHPKHISSRFMTITYNCTESFKKVHKAVVHIDGTARPQIVSEDLNGDYYRIVKAYCDKTGERSLVNTSFNEHEEPIVCSPHDAVGSLLNNNVDVLVIGNYIVTVKDF